MAFRWKDYLELASVLKAQGDAFHQECCFRSATSRAYYAAYCHARNWAVNHGFIIRRKGPDVHKELREHFSSIDISIADKLDDMRKWRNTCDYDDLVSYPKKLATDAIREAEFILKSL